MVAGAVAVAKRDRPHATLTAGGVWRDMSRATLTAGNVRPEVPCRSPRRRSPRRSPRRNPAKAPCRSSAATPAAAPPRLPAEALPDKAPPRPFPWLGATQKAFLKKVLSLALPKDVSEKDLNVIPFSETSFA